MKRVTLLAEHATVEDGRYFVQLDAEHSSLYLHGRFVESVTDAAEAPSASQPAPAAASAESLRGLRRMVEHSRDLLAPHCAVAEGSWSALTVRRVAAVQLAHEVLDLVAACIGDEDDEVTS